MQTHAQCVHTHTQTHIHVWPAYWSAHDGLCGLDYFLLCSFPVCSGSQYISASKQSFNQCSDQCVSVWVSEKVIHNTMNQSVSITAIVCSCTLACTKMETLSQQLNWQTYFVNKLVKCKKAVVVLLQVRWTSDAHGDSVGLGRIHYLHYQRVTSTPLIRFKSSTLSMTYWQFGNGEEDPEELLLRGKLIFSYGI